MEITQAQSEAADAILALQKLAYQSEARLYNDDSIPPLRQTLDEMRDDFTTQTILQAVEDGQIIGSVRAYQSQDTCHIGRLIVHPDYQGRGVGTALMKAIEDTFATAKRFALFTGSKSENNIRLYQKLGYHIFETKRHSEQVTIVSLEKHRREP